MINTFSIVGIEHKLEVICLSNRGSICYEKLTYTSKYKIGCWLLTLSGTDWRSNLNLFSYLFFPVKIHFLNNKEKHNFKNGSLQVWEFLWKVNIPYIKNKEFYFCQYHSISDIVVNLSR